MSFDTGVVSRSVNDTKMLMDMFAHRSPAFAEMEGAGEILAELGLVALIAAFE